MSIILTRLKRADCSLSRLTFIGKSLPFSLFWQIQPSRDIRTDDRFVNCADKTNVSPVGRFKTIPEEDDDGVESVSFAYVDQ